VLSFVNTISCNDSWLPGNFAPRRRTIQILRKAGLSGILLCNLYSEQSYWAKMGNQRYMHYNDDGHLESFGTCFTSGPQVSTNRIQRYVISIVVAGTLVSASFMPYEQNIKPRISVSTIHLVQGTGSGLSSSTRTDGLCCIETFSWTRLWPMIA
jgi:hypothetical protein